MATDVTCWSHWKPCNIDVFSSTLRKATNSFDTHNKPQSTLFFSSYIVILRSYLSFFQYSSLSRAVIAQSV
jgi:hypothetical protein